MKIHTLPYILYRSYPEFGYLTDNRNYGYDTASRSCLKVGELLLSKVAGVFYSVLTCHSQNIDAIVDKLCLHFPDIPPATIRKDAIDFYTGLHKKGFLFAGDDETTVSSRYFSYKNMQPYSLDLEQNQVSNSIYLEAFGGSCQLNRVHLDIAGCCNESCIHCYIPNKNKCGVMSEELFDKILIQCKEMNVLNLTISGGEPMLNPCLVRFLQRCKQDNFSVNVLSNLTMLSNELLDVFSDNPLISVQTSLYAMEEEIHDKITRNKGSFRKTLNSIKRLHERNVPLQINCPIMKQNLQYYKDVLQFAQSMNIEADTDYSLFGCYDSSKSNLSCRLSIEEIEKNILANQDNQEKSEDLHNRDKGSDTPICPVCKSSLCISNSGNVYPCEGWQTLLLGNIHNQHLRTIWEESPQVRYLRGLTFGHFPKCNSCQDKIFCSPCLIMNSNEDAKGDYTNINPFMCEVARIKKMKSMRMGYPHR